MPLSPESTRSSVDVIIVNWDHEDMLPVCLGSLSRSIQSNYRINRIVIVDNSPSPRFTPERYEGLPEVSVVPTAANLGFAAGCNLGARDSEADYLLFLNPDTQVGPRSIASAVGVLDDPAFARVGLLGPLVIDKVGNRKSTCTRFPTVRRVFNRVIGLSLLAPRWFPGMWTDPQPTGVRVRTVDCVSGACLFARRRLFERIGGFDERLFLYYEDADLSLRALRLGWLTAFLDDDPIVHESGWTRGDDRAWRLAHSWRSLMTYAWKFFDPVRAACVTAIVLVLAPVARLGQSAWHRSPREAGAALGAYVWLWYLLAQDVISRGHTAPPSGCASDADGTAAPGSATEHANIG